MGPAEAVAAKPDRLPPRHDPSAAECTPAVRARVRLSRMIWDVVVRIGALLSALAVLLSLLIDESPRLHLVSALVFALLPALAALLLGATLVGLLRLVGVVYDLARTFVLPGLVRV